MFTQLDKLFPSDVEIETIKLKAEQGDFQAKVTLGYYYKTGKGVSKNLKIAMMWFAKVYLQDENAMGGMNNLITCLEEGEPMPIEVTQLLEAKIQEITNKAISGNRAAQLALGYYHMKGVCTPKNQAMVWFAKAYLQDEKAMGGMNNLLLCIAEGMTMPEEAVRLLEPTIGGLSGAYYAPLVAAIEKRTHINTKTNSTTVTGSNNFLPGFNDFDTATNSEKSALTFFAAAANGELENLKFTIKHKMVENVNLRDRVNNSALMLALGGGHKSCAEYLISLGADLETTGTRAKDIFECARVGGCETWFRKFLQERSEMTGSTSYSIESLIEALGKCKIAKDPAGFLPDPNLALRRAAAAGKIEVIKTILGSLKSIDINQQGTESKQTALHYAVINEQSEAVSLLVAAGAKFDIEDKHKKMPADYAKELPNDAIRLATGLNKLRL